MNRHEATFPSGSPLQPNEPDPHVEAF
jgi:hypothetical protein